MTKCNDCEMNKECNKEQCFRRFIDEEEGGK